jgi:hypothetical protein
MKQVECVSQPSFLVFKIWLHQVLHCEVDFAIEQISFSALAARLNSKPFYILPLPFAATDAFRTPDDRSANTETWSRRRQKVFNKC